MKGSGTALAAFMNIYILSNFFVAVLSVLEVLILIRLAFIAVGRSEGVIWTFVFCVTEPVIMPIRALLSRVEAVRSASMDISLAVGLFIFTLLKYTFVYR